MILALFTREMRLMLRQSHQIFVVFAFFLLNVILYPMALLAGQELLNRIAGAVVWATFLFAALFTLPNMFQHDRQSGILSQMLLSPIPNMVVVAIKVITHTVGLWVTIIIALPFTAAFLQLSWDHALAIAVSLLIGAMALSLLGCIVASLYAHSNLLLPLMVIPFYLPVLILGTAIANAGLYGESYSALSMVLLGVTILVAPLCLWLSSQSLENY